MSSLPAPARRDELAAALSFLTGHLQIGSARDEQAVHALQDELARSLAADHIAAATHSRFSVDGSDLYSAEAVAPQLRKRIEAVAKRVGEAPADEPELRVFVRDVPVRSTQLAGSVPLWAAGAAVHNSLGPFINPDGRRVWFDFFKITRLAALYIEGRPDPAILFNVSIAKKHLAADLPPIVDALTVYQLVPDSVWIASALLAPDAPAGRFTGLKVSGGSVTLSAAPKLVAGKLTLAPNTRLTVALDLVQPGVTDADPASAYGVDARHATLRLPRQLRLHLGGGGGGGGSDGGRAIDAVGGDIAWRVYGQAAEFRWNPQRPARFDATLNRVLVPLDPSASRFELAECESPFTTFDGAADVSGAAWALPVAQIDVAQPLAAAGIGGIAMRTGAGLTVRWQGLRGGSVALAGPWLLVDPGRINITDRQAGNVFCTQAYRLWKDELNRHGATVKLHYTAAFPFVYNSFANGNEAYLAVVDANPLLDRPVMVTGQPFDIRSKHFSLVVAVSKALKLIYLFDDDILFDRQDATNLQTKRPPPPPPPPLALALHNALFKVTPVNGCLLFGTLADDMVQVEKAAVFLTFGLYAYVPTLPDPYAANLGVLKAQFERVAASRRSAAGGQAVWLWLVSQTRWEPASPEADKVEVSFHFAPLADQFGIASPDAMAEQPFVQLFGTAAVAAPVPEPAPVASTVAFSRKTPPDNQAIWDAQFAFFRNDAFSLLDVSSNANQMGVSFAWFQDRSMAMVRTHDAVAEDGAADTFPLQVRGLDVVARSKFVRAFTTPIVAWEPVVNLTPPEAGKLDPPVPLNYYPDDGGPTKIVNNSAKRVAVAPIPLCDWLVDSHASEPGNITAAYFTLPFGIRSLAYLYKTNGAQLVKPTLGFVAPSFGNGLTGGIQLRLGAGSAIDDRQDNYFRGFTLQMNNVRDLAGAKTGTTTLGEDVAFIFNQDFHQAPTNMDSQKGVPLKRIDLSGYGASTFSDWHNPAAQFAATSQARFDVMIGRTAHEVVQVKSIVYPWGIKVVRTVTLFRVGSGYVYRVDSGWKAESDGLFDFRFEYVADKSQPDKGTMVAPYVIHPGTVQGLFNVQNIRTAIGDVAPMLGTMDIRNFYFVEETIDRPMKSLGTEAPLPFDLQPIYFDADVALESVVQGQTAGRVPGKKILGFVQRAPGGIPLTPLAFQALLERQLGAIGGPLDCIMDIGLSGQKLRVNRIEVNASVDAAGAAPVFVAAPRGNVVLPKDGSWSLVSHARGTGEVTPLAEGTSVPLIRIGPLGLDMAYPTTALLRIANPADLLRAPRPSTINFGFLQSTNTQKVLFLTPAFAKQPTAAAPGKLLSKTPPLFVDAYRLLGSKAVFPNIGDAETDLGSAIALTKNFAASALQDGGRHVLELMTIASADGINRLKDDGYKLLNAVKNFDLPKGPWHLIDEDYLKVYVEYGATTQNPDASTQPRTGSLDFDVDSFATSVGDRWKSRLNNIAMVVDLGPFPRLVTIKGNFDAKKGSEAGYVGSAADPGNFPAPQIELSDALEKAKDILQILAALQGGDYVDAFKRGMRVAMSNGADSWEYKFEVSQEIPVLKFPPGPLANDPNAPMKLEASLKFGVYFNSALTTAALSDPKKLLPTAGAFVEFYGRMSVMCVSLSIATVYAVGQVNLRISGDTKVGPALDMKFGFGAQIVIGLPLVGNVSVLYMIGVEMYADSKTLDVSAFLLYQGHAELLGGLVGVTITIEAKGTIKRTPDETLCAVQVTFAIDISIFLVIDIDFGKSWEEERQIA